MMAYYPMVIEFCIEFKRFSSKYIADFNKEVHNESMRDKDAPLVDSYPLKYDSKNDMIYCLKDIQTIQERESLRSNLWSSSLPRSVICQLMT